MKIGIYTGSFDPVHSGHVNLAQAIARSGIVDSVWLTVSRRNPFKPDSTIASEQDRLTMARLATEAVEGVEVSDCEMNLPAPSFTIDTLNALSLRYPFHSFRPIIGADNWKGFFGWKSAEEILERFGLIIYPRPGYDIDKTSLAQGVTVLEDMPVTEAASTDIRRELAAGKPAPQLLDPKVADYIVRHKLYF